MVVSHCLETDVVRFEKATLVEQCRCHHHPVAVKRGQSEFHSNAVRNKTFYLFTNNCCPSYAVPRLIDLCSNCFWY